MSGIDKKICSKCGVNSFLCEFVKNKTSKGGYSSICKVCRKEQQQKWVNQNPDYQKEYHQNNKESHRVRSKKHYDKNRDIILSKRVWGDDNNDYQRRYRSERNTTDPIYKLINTMRSRLRKYIKLTKITKINTTSKYIGCSPSQLREHIENQFTDGMSWDNHGLFGWHVDHIIPLSSIKNEEDIIKLCHYTNLQPLWAEDNLSKSNKILV